MKHEYNRKEDQRQKLTKLIKTQRAKNTKKKKRFICLCPRNCPKKVPVGERLVHFERFKDLAYYNLQTAALCAAVREIQVTRPQSKHDHSRKKHARRYTSGQKKVCSTLFCRTLRVSNKRIDTVLKRQRPASLLDERGTLKSKISAEERGEVPNQSNKKNSSVRKSLGTVGARQR